MRLTGVGLAAAIAGSMARPAPAQDLPFVAPALPDTGDDAARRVRGAVVQLVWAPDDPGLAAMRRTIASIEADASDAVRRLGARASSQPARTAFAQGSVLDDAWWAVEHAELVGVPPRLVTPLRRAVSRRVAPLRCAAIDRYFATVRLSPGAHEVEIDSIRQLAADRLAVHGRAAILQCRADRGDDMLAQ